MAKIEQYDLAVAPFRQPVSLAKRGARIAFAYFNPDPIIGIFRPRSRRVTEFELPFAPGIFTFQPSNLLWRGNRVVAATTNGPLVELNPANGEAVYYEGFSKNPWLASHNIAMDSNRDVWIACYYRHGMQTGLIPGLARLKIRRRRVYGRFWQLPIDFVQPYDLWIDDSDRVWFSIYSTGTGGASARYSIGRLDPAGGELKGWRIMDGLDPHFPSIGGLPSAPEVWFTREQPSGLYRLDLASDKITSFSHPMVNGLQNLAVDGFGNPWFSANDGYISMVSRHETGVPVNSRHQVWSIEGHTETVTRTVIDTVQRPDYTTPVLGTTEPEQTVGPFVRWEPPGLTTGRPRGVFLKDDEVWFTDMMRNRLGILVT